MNALHYMLYHLISKTKHNYNSKKGHRTMNEKDYEKYAEQMEGCNRLFDDEVAKVAEATTKTVSDWRLSEQGKESKKKENFEALNKTAEMIATVAKKGIGEFCKDFAITLPEDDKDHTKDIENALHIVDMLGFGLDVKNLENALAPMRGSFRSVKTVVDLIDAKQKNATGNGVGFAPEVLDKMYQYMGINSRVNDYLNIFSHIENIIDNPADVYRFEVTSRSNATLITLQSIIPYDFLACADWMKKCGQEYAALEEEFSSLFTGHVATDREILESIYQG